MKPLASVIPDNEVGKPVDIMHSIVEENTEQALDTYKRACKRLMNPPVWHQVTGNIGAEFTLTEDGSNPAERLMQAGDLVKINVPGPGNHSGEGFDWVKVETVEENTLSGADESVILVLRPTAHPGNTAAGTAHFFKEEASSTFLIQRQGLEISAAYYGRNELINIKDGSFLDHVRNGLVGFGAFIGFSNIQWDILIKGFLTKEIGDTHQSGIE